MSYTFTQTGSEIQAILDRAEAGGQIDQDIAAKQDQLTFDDAPTSGSDNPVKSGGIYDAIQAGGATALAAFATDSVSGDVVSFSDGADNIPVKSFTGSILPVQNLNGYDNPWPAGGGANKWDEQWEVGAYNGSTGAKVTAGGRIRSKNKIPVTPSATYFFKGPSNFQVYEYESDESYIKYTDIEADTTLTLGATTHFITFNMGANSGETYGHNIAVNYPSTVTTYSTYSNICPISGWSGAEIYRTQWVQGSYNVQDGDIDTSTRIRTGWVKKTGTTLNVYIEPSTGYEWLAFGADTATGGNPVNLVNWRNSGSGTTISKGYFKVVVRKTTNADIAPGEVPIRIVGAEPIIALTFGQTVYAGTITALGGGKWSVQPTHAIETYDKNTDWRRYSGGFYANSTGLVATSAQISNGICNAFATRVGASEEGFNAVSIGSSPTRYNPRFYHGGLTEIADWVQYLTDTNLTIQFLYVPDTIPDPIIVDASDLETLLGANTVWTDVGAVTEMEYRADTKLYIQKLLQA